MCDRDAAFSPPREVESPYDTQQLPLAAAALREVRRMGRDIHDARMRARREDDSASP